MALRSLFAFLLLLGGVAWTVLSGTAAPEAPGKETAPSSQEHHQRLLEIARRYRDYVLVDNKFRFVPTYCNDPSRLPIMPFLSASKDTATHGQKIYLLYASKANATQGTYLPKGDKAPIGLSLVKESWKPQEITPEEAGKFPAAKAYPKDLLKVVKGDRTYFATDQGPLFIMTKLDPQTPGTDDGWVYGTVSADGKTVTSAGRVESCMGCHVKATKDRLFGYPAR
jgi:hypothetical protein